MKLPSDLTFASFLQYSPRGQTKESKYSQAVMRAIKGDGVLPSGQRGIDYAARRLREELPKHPFLQKCFGPSVALIPTPRSAPLKDPGWLWPAKRLCDAIQKEGLAAAVLPLVIRKSPVAKSATAAPGQRPTPENHYDSLAVDPKVVLLPGIKSFTLVDDVVTRGATFIASVARLQDVYALPMHVFALVRTMSGVEVDRVLSPVEGTISYQSSSLHREP